MDENNNPQSFSRSFFRESWELIKIIIVSLAIVLPIRLYIAQPFIVRGASMEPTYQDGEYLIIDELSYLLREPMRGEVVVFRYPEDTSQFFIKRIVGLPGETVIVENGTVVIQNVMNPNGFVLDESYIADIVTSPNSKVVLSENEYYVLGDNRPKSSDSRRWGALEDEFLIGRAFLRLWPVTEVGVVTRK